MVKYPTLEKCRGSLLAILAAILIFPATPTLAAVWSVDFQATTSTWHYNGGGGDYWNVSTLPHWGGTIVNPSWAVLDSTQTHPSNSIAFSITGTVSSFTGNGYGNGNNPLGADYMLFFGPNALSFQISGLAPGQEYELIVFGASQHNNRDFEVRLGDGPWVYVPNEDWSSIPVAGGGGDPGGGDPGGGKGDVDADAGVAFDFFAISASPTFGDPPAHIPPWASVTGVANANGELNGEFVVFSTNEGNWSGFQLIGPAIPEPASGSLAAMALFSLAAVVRRKK